MEQQASKYTIYLGVYGMINVVECVRNALECTYKDKGKREYVCKYDISDRNSLESGAICIVAYTSVEICDLSWRVRDDKRR